MERVLLYVRIRMLNLYKIIILKGWYNFSKTV